MATPKHNYLPASTPRQPSKDPEVAQVLQNLASSTLDPLLRSVAQLQSQLDELQAQVQAYIDSHP